MTEAASGGTSSQSATREFATAIGSRDFRVSEITRIARPIRRMIPRPTTATPQTPGPRPPPNCGQNSPISQARPMTIGGTSEGPNSQSAPRP